MLALRWRGIFLCALVVIQASATYAKDYRGHTVIRVHPETPAHLRTLMHLNRKTLELDFWKEPKELNSSVDINVPPHLSSYVRARLRRSLIKQTTVIPDLHTLIDDQNITNEDSTGNMTYYGLTLNQFHTHQQINDWLDRLAEHCGTHCSVFSIGESYEGRDMKVIKIGTGEVNNSAMWIDAGIHAREWIAPAAATNIIAKLLSEIGKGGPIDRLVSDFNWYILPVANPDGYDYTWTTDRLWRKTRSVNENSHCRGADPNRNFNYFWGVSGTSTDPCSDTFGGARPFSEKETRAIRDFILSHKEQLKSYISLHAYGQFWLCPWGYTYHTLPLDYGSLLAMGNIGAQALERRHGHRYSVGTPGQLLYASAGGSDDWAKGVAKIPYSYTIELRDTGHYGFVLSPSLIIPTAEELTDGITAVAQELAKKQN